jgi:hypothetical protein
LRSGLAEGFGITAQGFGIKGGDGRGCAITREAGAQLEVATRHVLFQEPAQSCFEGRELAAQVKVEIEAAMIDAAQADGELAGTRGPADLRETGHAVYKRRLSGTHGRLSGEDIGIGMLQFMETMVDAFGGEQLIVCSDLGNAPGVEHNDLVRLADG